MRKSISIFIVLTLLIVTLCPVLTYADENQTVSNDFYSIKLPAWAKVLSQTKDTVIISDNDLSFSAKISFEEITKDDINAVRKYLSDDTSEDSKIFDSIIDLKAKSYEAAEKSYNNSSSFYPMDKEYSELNFKIIDKNVQELFGVRSFSIMYNTLDATMNRLSEYSKIDIYVPSYDKGIYEFNITMPREQANINTVLKISELLVATKLADHPAEDKVPLVLVANDNIQKSAAGIYPAYTFKNYNMVPFSSKEMGISFYYPDFLIPTDKITDFDGMKSSSFKIDPYTTFNVMTADSNLYSLNEAVASAFTSIEEGASVKKVNVLDSPNGDIYEIIYSYIKNDINYEKRTYALSSNGNTVVYSILTSQKNSSYSLDNLIIRILITTKTFEKAQDRSVSAYTYKEKDLGNVALNLPDNFNIQYRMDDSIKITSPEINTFQIYVYQENLNREIDFASASRIANSNSSEIKSSFAAPYTGKQSTFIGGRVSYTQDYIKIYRLNKYMDTNNRLHYCYTISIGKGEKLNSVLIDVNSMLFKEDGKVGRTMPGILNDIAQSFNLK